jgi:hypothetical protein
LHHLQEPPVGPPELLVSKAGPADALVGTPIIYTVTAGVAPGNPAAAVLTLVEQLDSTKAEFVQPMPDPSSEWLHQAVGSS